MASGGKLSSMKVEIQCKKWIKPSTPTPSHLQRHQLSSIDQLQPSYFVPLIFHFDIGNATTPPDQRLARLEESLSEILTWYYPFAGRYDEDESTVCCEDQGLEFVVAAVDRRLDELANGEYDKEVLLCGLERILLASDVAWTPVVSVQVNVFTCGGLAICLSFYHKVADMFTISTFMDAWATACRLGTLDQAVRPSFNISSLLPPRDYLKPSKSAKPPPTQTNIQPPPKFVSERYIFTGEAISKLKSATSESDESNNMNYTRVELVTALITRSLINIECSKGALLRPLVISQPMNLRPKVPLPMEENLVGNLCTKLRAALEVENHESLELRELAVLIRNSAKSVASEMGKVGDWSELSQRVEKTYMEFNEEARKGDEKVNMVRFSSWCRFGLYDVDFGWGRPSLVYSISVPGVIFIILMDCKSDVDDGGIEAWVCLKEDDMARFQQEPDILAYASS